MADDHVAAVADPETELESETGNGSLVVRGVGSGTPSLLRHAQDRKGAAPTGELYEFQQVQGGSASPGGDLHAEPSVLQPRVRYPLDSKRLTA